MKYRIYSLLCSALLAMPSLANAAKQETLPIWELGGGLGFLQLPHYPGSDQSQTLVLPFPMIIYRGETVRADRGGLRGILFEKDNIRFDISIRGSLPVNSSNNRARAGMQDLDPTVEIGPQLAWTALQTERDTLQARLPIRAVISLGNKIQHQGNVASPNLRWDHHFSPRLRASTRLSARYGNGKWHDYFYSVSAADALPERPEYDAAGGYGGISLSFNGTYKLHDWRIDGGVGIESLSGASFENSPLVKDRNSYFVGFALSKMFFKSERKTQTTVESDH